jgi:hypothetical protein
MAGARRDMPCVGRHRRADRQARSTVEQQMRVQTERAISATAVLVVDGRAGLTTETSQWLSCTLRQAGGAGHQQGRGA